MDNQPLWYNCLMHPKLIEKFNRIVLPMDGCWVWQGEKTKAGYGMVSLSIGGKRVRNYAHRISLYLKDGHIKEGHQACHHCDNPICVNPDHLFSGTQRDNTHDMMKKGRWNAGPPVGERNPSAKLSEQEVLDIRRLHELGVSQHELARIYPVHRFVISEIVHRNIWKHI